MRFLIVFILISFNLVAQERNTFHYRDHVEAYYDKELEKPIYIYEDIAGKVIDTLYNIESKYAYYKIAILKSEYGWFKLKNIQRLPDELKDYGHQNKWIKTDGFTINVENYDENHQIYLYDLPSKKSNRIHKLDNFQITSIIETSDLWAKVKFKVGKKNIEGWLDFRDQCAYPWTTCTKFD